MADRRLTEAQRREIAQDRAKGVSAQDLAARFGVTRRTIERTVAGQRSERPTAQASARPFSVWVSAQELRTFDAAIARQGLSRSEAMKRMMRAAAQLLAPDDDLADRLRDLSVGLAKAGGNVNQIARALNEARVRGLPPPYTRRSDAELRELAAFVFDLAQQVRDVAGSRRAHLDLALTKAFREEGPHEAP
jgi:transcriptional regulator with XRE-family HTH domain